MQIENAGMNIIYLSFTLFIFKFFSEIIYTLEVL